MKILVAEDDCTSMLILKSILQRPGIEVVEAADGESAYTLMMAPDAPRLAIISV